MNTPVYSGIIANYVCTASCRHCMFASSPDCPKEYITAGMAEHVAGILEKAGTESVHIGGGEPFMNFEALCGLIEALHRHGVEIDYIETNAFWCGEDGGYWRGGVWAPTNYMVLKGLDKYGYNDLVYDIAKNSLENVITVFQNDATLYEDYAPESASKGTPSKSDFVGWTGLFPISILFEYVFGIRPFAMEERIVWDVRLLEEHGIRNYPLGELTLDLICRERASLEEEPDVTVTCERPVKVEIRYADKTKVIYAVPKK